MKTTLEIPDELYRQAKIRAAQENRGIKDIVSEGLRLMMKPSTICFSPSVRRMTKAPVAIRKGNKIPVLTNDEMAELLGRAGERLP